MPSLSLSKGLMIKQLNPIPELVEGQGGMGIVHSAWSKEHRA